ncbi:uncharacterized protein LOC134261255 isoform X1 [Saccostrea cucullata]|uniref:uncharacterized protein LOC134261255 isoform X1 n=1 Tax=Saccostrea cuccullata TaxID=36930 RepID=UPI002ED5B5C4
MGNGPSTGELFVSNDSDGDAWILLTPTKDYPLTGYFAKDSELSNLVRAGVTVDKAVDLFNAWTKGKWEKKEKGKITAAILDFFKNTGLHLTFGFARDVYDKSLCNPLHYLSAYGWGVLNNSEEMCVTVLLETPNGELKMAQFRTLKNWSWVVNCKCVTPTKGGTLWEKRIPTGYPLLDLDIKDD